MYRNFIIFPNYESGSFYPKESESLVLDATLRIVAIAEFQPMFINNKPTRLSRCRTTDMVGIARITIMGVNKELLTILTSVSLTLTEDFQ